MNAPIFLFRPPYIMPADLEGGVEHFATGLKFCSFATADYNSNVCSSYYILLNTAAL